MENEIEYQNRLKEKHVQWEKICLRCGGCCGAFDDPCLHLRKDNDNKYFCEIYQSRFGTRKTVNGEEFYCVPIQKILNTHWKNDHLCPYKKIKSNL